MKIKHTPPPPPLGHATYKGCHKKKFAYMELHERKFIRRSMLHIEETLITLRRGINCWRLLELTMT